MLDDQEDREEPALAAYAKAAELGSVNFYAYYRHAQLLWRLTPDKAALDQIAWSLDKTIKLNPD